MVFIFDFDGLFYSGEHVFDSVKDWFTKNRRAMFPNISDADYEKIISENPEFLQMEGGSDISRYMYMFKEKYPHLDISVDAYVNLQNEEIETINLEDAHLVDTAFLKEATKKVPSYVVSNSSQKHLYHYMDKIGIDPTWFKKLISNHFEEFDQSKKHYYADIIAEQNAKPEDIHVFGDSYKSDLVPAIELGANAHHVTDSHKLKEEICQIPEFQKLMTPTSPEREF